MGNWSWGHGVIGSWGHWVMGSLGQGVMGQGSRVGVMGHGIRVISLGLWVGVMGSLMKKMQKGDKRTDALSLLELLIAAKNDMKERTHIYDSHCHFLCIKCNV